MIFFQFNSSKQFSADSPGFIATPSPKDRIHVVVFVMDATSVYTFPPAITDKIKSLQAKINQRGTITIVCYKVMTRPTCYHRKCLLFGIKENYLIFATLI